jgi:peptidoglycan/xylan/chitin deacetylase (PgdA/CDA1 family)
MCNDHVNFILPGESEHGIILTFDDGEKSIYEYAFPILRKFRIKAIVFLIAGYIGKQNHWDISPTGTRVNHMSWDEIEVMHKHGIEFGSHTVSHRNLTKLNSDAMEYELGESKRMIEEKLNSCRCISYPFNRVNTEVMEMAKNTGYEYGFGGDGSHELLLQKEAIYITDTVKSLRVKIFGKPRMWYGYERIKQKIINYFTIATMISRSVRSN